MCTLSLVRAAAQRGVSADTGGAMRGIASSGVLFRVLFNRDEKRSRPASLAPVISQLQRHQAAMPIDPVSKGTWIAVNDAGLVACLLNANPGSAQENEGAFSYAGRRSRGGIVPMMMDAGTVSEASEIAERIDACDFPPFRLTVVDASEMVVFSGDGRSVRRSERIVEGGSSMVTSSGLGDAIVEGPRRAWFDAGVLRSSDQFAAQTAFHAHRAGHLGVLMSRADARTVSIAAVDVYPTHVKLSVALLDDDLQALGGSEVTLARVDMTSPA